MLDFIHRLKVKTKHAVKDGIASTELNHTHRAELLWSQAAQMQLLQDPHSEKSKGQFGLILDNSGTWKYGGHLSKAETPHDVKYQILLPRQHHLTTLVVRCAHLRILHNGVKETPVKVRGGRHLPPPPGSWLPP